MAKKRRNRNPSASEVPTRLVRRTRDSDTDGTAKFEPDDGGQDMADEPTTPIDDEEDFSARGYEETKLLRWPKSELDDPVVGWIVVVGGPGKGRSFAVGLGANGIGRDEDERISLSFGDEQISRSKHAVITFDVKHQTFYVQHGKGKNLTYVNDDPVLAPVELQGGEEIAIGSTQLRFVRLCGPNFSWSDG